MKMIIVLDASGRTCKQVVDETLNAGYQATVIVRNTEDYIFGHPLTPPELICLYTIYPRFRWLHWGLFKGNTYGVHPSFKFDLRV